jgi:hypothetical protein
VLPVLKFKIVYLYRRLFFFEAPLVCAGIRYEILWFEEVLARLTNLQPRGKLSDFLL